MARLAKRSFSLSGHRTSVALEAEFWDALEGSARAEGVSLSAFIARIDGARPDGTPLASALRVRALGDALDDARGQGRAAVGSRPGVSRL